MPHYDEARGILNSRISGSSAVLASDINSATSKATPVDADELPITDSAAAFILKKLTWANLKATLATWLNGGTIPATFTSVAANRVGGYGINLSGASTNWRGILLGNTGATSVLGIESSAGGVFVTGSPGYSTTLVTFDTNPIILAVANVEKLRATTTGVAVTGTLSSTGALTTPGGASFHTTSSALANGAGAGAGTLLTAPVAGNPTKWIGINDNGTIRYIPAW